MKLLWIAIFSCFIINLSHAYSTELTLNLISNPTWTAWNIKKVKESSIDDKNRNTKLSDLNWEKSLLLALNSNGNTLALSPFILQRATNHIGEKGNLQIQIPTAPDDNLNFPTLIVTGVGKHFSRAIAWHTPVPITHLPVGIYEISSNTVSNATHTYQATPVTAQVNKHSTTKIALTFNKINYRPDSWNNIKHVVIIVLENTAAITAVKQPYLKSLLSQGAYLSHSFGIAHPSQPNYFALVGGTTFNIIDNENHNLSGKHIAQLLANKGLTWKSYVEAFPGNCFTGKNSGDYYRKHAPFISFIDIQTNPSECANIVKATEFFKDLQAKQLPTYSFYVPDIRNIGHNTGVAYADKWLFKTFSPVFNNPAIMKETLFIITFDEDNHLAWNQIYTLFLGAGVKSGIRSETFYTHYSVLKTIEAILQLGSLGANDVNAGIIDDIWL